MSLRTVNGSSRSENGWPIVNRDQCILVPGPYMNTAPLQIGVAADVLGEFVRRHHVQVEPIRSSVWGWSATNDVLGGYGQNNGSNHLGGTCVDINAPWRPWGALVLSNDMVQKTYRLLQQFGANANGDGGAIFWGRKWNRHDEMHFQLGWLPNDSRWPALIAQIKGGPVVAPPIPVSPSVPAGSWNPTLQYGSSGAAVAELQRDMNREFDAYEATPLVVDGDFGPATKSAVLEFQRRVHITPDGIVGPQTWTEFAKYGVKL